MSNKINICIVHYNTPELLDACIKSIRKHMNNIYIFENSDRKPFTNTYDNVEIIDNTKGQIINYDEWFKNYPECFDTIHYKLNKCGSARHTYAIEKCIDIINDNFILLDSDVLVKKDISDLFDETCLYVGEEEHFGADIHRRIFPFICFINVKMMKELRIRYMNEKEMIGLTKNGDYDTGSELCKSGRKYKHKDIKYSDYIEHLGSGSWRCNNWQGFLDSHKELYE